jgi:hypothetical protein
MSKGVKIEDLIHSIYELRLLIALTYYDFTLSKQARHFLLFSDTSRILSRAGCHVYFMDYPRINQSPVGKDRS